MKKTSDIVVALASNTKGNIERRNKLINLCDLYADTIEYLPMSTNKYLFADGSSITISLRTYFVGE